jgi:hypothetical protein
MAASRLSRDDHALLDQLNDGPQTILGNRLRDGADRLVAAGYATSRSLNMSVVDYEITKLGKIALALKQFGVWNTDFSVEPHRFEVNGLWYLKVTSEGNPALMMDIGSATKLMIVLRSVGADDMADEFEREINKARRYAGV